jgi:hypothetical protein
MVLYDQYLKINMKAPEAIQNHLKVASNVADAEQIIAAERGLGSYTIATVGNRGIIPLDPLTAIETNFSSIDVLNGTELTEEYDSFAKLLDQDPKKKAIFETLSENDQSMFKAALFANEIASRFFDKNQVDLKTRDSSWIKLDPDDESSYLLKKLSETSDSGYCVERSLFSQEVMARLGQDVKYSVGYYQYWPDEEGEYHAFLGADNGRVIIDPLNLAKGATPIPFGLFLASNEDQTFITNPEQRVMYTDPIGREISYSASPIPAQQLAA